MPTPTSNESHDDFIERCVPYVIDEDNEIDDNEQALAYCESIWKEQSNGLQKLLFKLKID